VIVCKGCVPNLGQKPVLAKNRITRENTVFGFPQRYLPQKVCGTTTSQQEEYFAHLGCGTGAQIKDLDRVNPRSLLQPWIFVCRAVQPLICPTVELGPVYRSVAFRDFGGETRRWRLNQHHIPIDVAKLFTLVSTV